MPETHVLIRGADILTSADAALETLRKVEGGEEASIIGEVREEPARMVVMHTLFGGTRMIDMLVGDPLPRIC